MGAAVGTQQSTSSGHAAITSLPTDRRDDLISLGLAVYGLAAFATLLLTGAHLEGGIAALRAALLHNLASLTYDDGFYYFEIARRLAHGAGSTFDGLHLTNGYHPLWLLCLVPIFWLINSPDNALIAIAALQGLLLAAGVALLYRIARLTMGRVAASLAALLWVQFQFIYWMAFSGLEYDLHALCLLMVMYYYLRYFVDTLPPPRIFFGLGVLASLCFLARIDTVLLATVLGLWLAWREWRCGWQVQSVWRLLAFGIPVMAIVTLYFATNLWLFGHALPVSGAVKADWSTRELARDAHYAAQGWLVAKAHYLIWGFRNLRSLYATYLGIGTFGFWILGFGCWIVKARLRGAAYNDWLDWFGRTLLSLLPFALFGLLHLIGYVLLYHGGLSYQPWYYVLQPILATLLIAVIADVLSHSQLPSVFCLLPSVLLLACCCVVPLFTAHLIRQKGGDAQDGLPLDPRYAAAQWVGAHLPPDTVLGSWNAGMISYYSGRSIVNLDGLVNSWDFYEYGQRDLCRYWRETRVSYLVDMFDPARPLESIEVDATPCAGQLQQVWLGPGYPGTPWRALVYRLSP